MADCRVKPPSLLVGDRRVDLPSFVVVEPRAKPPSAKCSYYHPRIYFLSHPSVFIPCLFESLFTYIHIYLSTYLPIYLYLSIHLSVYLAICLSVDKPISCLFTYLSQQYFHCDRQALPCKSPYNSTASTKTAITNMEAATRVRFAHLNSTLKCRTRPENPGAEPHPSHRRGSPHQRRSHFMQKIQDFVRF